MNVALSVFEGSARAVKHRANLCSTADVEKGSGMGTTKRIDKREQANRDPLLAARVEKSMHNDVKQAAAAAGVTLSDWVREAVTLRLNDQSLLQTNLEN